MTGRAKARGKAKFEKRGNEGKGGNKSGLFAPRGSAFLSAVRMHEEWNEDEGKRRGRRGKKRRERAWCAAITSSSMQVSPLKVLLALVTLSASILVVDPLFFSLLPVFA